MDGAAGFNGAAPVRARKFDRNHLKDAYHELLQRGRACEGAEIPSTSTAWWLSCPCFNGAAPVRARKYPTRPVPPSGVSGLQRGRACEGAEIRVKAGAQEGQKGASTGPRL